MRLSTSFTFMCIKITREYVKCRLPGFISKILFFTWHCCRCCQVTSVVSDSVRPHRRQPTRLPLPWDSGRTLEWAAIAFSVCQGYSLHLSYPLLPPPCPQVPPVYLHLYYCPANINRFISTIFLDFSLCIYGNMIFYMIFLFF